VSDHDDPTHGPSEDPAFEDPAVDQLRALLADARATEPVPADVAARLDDTLAALREERLAEAGVVPLRRRRAVGRWLVAAAAVVVVGAGGAGIAQLTQDGANDAAKSADSAASSATGDTLTNGPAAPQETAASPAPSAQPPVSALKGVALPRFTTARFARQAATFDPATLDFTTNGTADKAYEASTPGESDAPSDSIGRAPSRCAGPSLPDTTTVPILLDGHRAVLVLHKVVDGTQEVDAWSCDGTTELTTTTVTR
jgi:hypothetical protein